MLRKKFYLRIGLCILVVLVVSFFFMRSQTPEEPIKIYKETPRDAPAKVSEAQEKETATSEKATGGHFHEDGTFHAEPHDATIETTTSRTSKAQQLERIQALEQTLQELKQKSAEKDAIIAEKKAIIAQERAVTVEVQAFDTWVSTLNFQEEFGELIALPSLSKEEIRERYTPEELRILVVDTVARFNAFREEFLTRLENCSPRAREIIEAHIHANSEVSEIYKTYIEKPFPVPEVLQ